MPIARVWTFKLRRGVMFQAPVSREVTAADVVADLRYLADPASASVMRAFRPPGGSGGSGLRWRVLNAIEGTDDAGHAIRRPGCARLVDRYTVRFSLRHPYSEFADTLGGPAFWVWPAGSPAQKVGQMRTPGTPSAPVRSSSSGGRQAGKSIDLVRNPEWWDTSGGPYLDAIHFQVFSSVGAMTLAFQKGLDRLDPGAPGPGRRVTYRCRKSRAGAGGPRALQPPALRIPRGST